MSKCFMTTTDPRTTGWEPVYWRKLGKLLEACKRPIKDWNLCCRCLPKFDDREINIHL